MDPNTNIPNNPDPRPHVGMVITPTPGVYSPHPPTPAPASPEVAIPQPLPQAAPVPPPNPYTPPQPSITQPSPHLLQLPTALPPSPQAISQAPIPPVVISTTFEPSESVPSTPVVGIVDPTYESTSAPFAQTSSKSRLKPLIIAMAAIVVLAGGSAAAYFGIIVPNQPQNVLKAAFINSLQQSQVSYKGSADFSYQSGGGTGGSPASKQSFKMTLDGSKDSTAKAGDIILGIEGYGVSVNVEARLVGQNLYLKVGDLSTVASLLGSLSPSLAAPASTISSDLSNQWIEIDQSLLSSAGLSCVLNTNLSINQADIGVLNAAYAKSGFLNVQSTSNDTVGTQATEKFSVLVDDSKAAGFISNLGNLSLVKSIDSCQPGASKSLAKSKGDNKKTPLTIWVSKTDKRIVRISYTLPSATQSTPVNGSLTMDLSYGNVSIATPANAEPAVQVLLKLQKVLTGTGLNINNLFNSVDGGSTSGTPTLTQ